MQNFALWRSRIEVPEATHATLKALAARYPLVAITNGNADPAQCGTDGYFQFVLRSGPDGRAKPYQTCTTWPSSGWAWRPSRSCTWATI